MWKKLNYVNSIQLYFPLNYFVKKKKIGLLEDNFFFFSKLT